ncbi:MAG: PCRF domain-containing protein, partial [Altererythrobacter sp.]|nr:PCRF domain-containing protein [Altererythrobacter sp.]
MKDSIRNKLDTLSERLEEIGALLADPETISDNNRFRELSKEYAQLNPIIASYQQYCQALDDIDAAKSMLEEEDAEMRAMAEEELDEAKQRSETLDGELQILLLPTDPHDESNVFLEIRAGAGGDEAAIFAGNLFRMYSRFAEQVGWQIEIISEHEGEHGGYKEIVARVIGKG